MKTDRKRKMLVCAGLILGIVLLLDVKAYAFGRDKGKDAKTGERWEKRVSEMHQKLGLSPEQEAALKTQREQHRLSMQALREKIQAQREQLTVELQKSELDMTRIRQLHNDLKALKAQKEDIHLEGILAIRKILTPDQYQKFMNMKEKFRDSSRHKRWNKGEKRTRSRDKKSSKGED